MTALSTIGFVTDSKGNPVEACSTGDPDVMFPDHDLSADHPDVQAAKQVCGSCFFKRECRDRALEKREPWGVWGGLTEKERHAILRRHRRHASAQQETLLEVAG